MRFFQTISIGLAVAAAIPAQQDLRALFPRQAPIYVTAEGLSKLELPVEVVSELSYDRSDMRILDASGAETPFSIDSALRLHPDARGSMRHALEIVDVQRTRTNRVARPPLIRERYVLAAPPNRDPRHAWDLALETRAPELVRRIRVSALIGSDETALVEDAPLFRMGDPRRERLRVTLPRFADARLVVSIEGEGEGAAGAYLEPEFRLEHSFALAAPDQDRLPLTVVSRREDGQQSVLELDRPRGLKPYALLIETTAMAFSRRVEVWDEGAGAEKALLGAGELYRIPGSTRLEDLEVGFKPATGQRLRVIIHNGDSPPLPDLVFTSMSTRLSLLFALPPQGEDTPAGTLLFGGARVPAAQYDFARLQGLIEAAQATPLPRATDLYRLTPARLGEITANDDLNDRPSLSFAMRPSGPIDPRAYTHLRTITLAPSPEGLSVVDLSLDDLAVAQPDLRDIRVVDDEFRQWAYLAERGAPGQVRVIGVAGPKSKDGASEYELTPPAQPAEIVDILLQIQGEFYDRAYELFGVRDDDNQFLLSRGRLQRRAGERQDPTITFQPARVNRMVLKVHDGDDAPLSIVIAQGRFPTSRLYVAAPAGVYSLLIGNEDDARPSYEIEQVRASVLAARGNEAALGPLEANPAYSSAARLARGDGPQQVLLWAALIVVVGGLSLVTLRMVRKTSPESTGSGDGGES